LFQKILVTGGAGFIGSNFLVELVPRYPMIHFVNMDKLTYAADLANLKEVDGSSNYSFIKGDISDGKTVNNVVKEGVDAIINFAAESHVDRSIASPNQFAVTNIYGCLNLLEAARGVRIKKFVQVSTDEVYGSLDREGFFVETTALAPNNPYSASKAAADCLTRAYYRTYGLNVCITRSVNNYGPHQHREKFIPNVIYHALRDEPIPIYGDGMHVRDWLFVQDHCRALERVLFHGKPGEVYNISTEEERTNLELAGSILHIMGKSPSLLNFVADRPGHDRRYAIKAEKIKKDLGWEPRCVLELALRKTVEWYLGKYKPELSY
jgi:dTDP-glucose 4,6-dehydratase